MRTFRRVVLAVCVLLIVLGNAFTVVAMSGAKTLGNAALLSKDDALAVLIVAPATILLLLILLLAAPRRQPRS